MKKRIGWWLIILMLSGVLVLAGCIDAPGTGQEKEELSEFSQFLMEEFRQMVQSDSITLHYTLAQPENYGVTVPAPTFGEYHAAAWKQEVDRAREVLGQLETFEYGELTKEEQLCWDVLKDSMEQIVAGEAFFLLQGVFSPTTGLQAQLPVLLAEYKFYDKNDVEEYLQLLACVPDYYDQILKAEQLRSESGYGLPERVKADIVVQCEDFIAEPEHNFLITTFSERLTGLAELNEDERLALAYENRRVVLESVIPAYEAIIAGLERLPVSEHTEGLSGYQKGREYYAWLVHSSTGSDWAPEEMAERLETLITTSLNEMKENYQADPQVLEQAADPFWPETEPEAILTHLREAIRGDYPEMADTDYQVKTVDPSLQEHLSPAFFLTPALDDWSNLAIYINKSPQNGSMEMLFPTLAHEGFPGHLYETVRFQQSDPAPIRQILPYLGYSEGWATYAEYESYRYAGFPDNLAAFLKANDLAVLAVCGRVDIGIHYEGWNLTDTYQYLASHGLASKKEEAEGLYWSCIGEPAGTLPYVIGYLEFWELRNQAEANWAAEHPGEEFPLKEYHTELLDLGPASFAILEKWLFHQ